MGDLIDRQSDTISRKTAIDALEKVADFFPWRVPGKSDTYDRYNEGWNDAIGRAEMEIETLPSAEPEISRIEQELHGKTPEEQYEFIYWLLFKSFEATAFSNSRLAIIEWLRGEK